MNKAKDFIRDHYTSIMLGIIILSVAGSLVLLAFLSASLNQQVLKSNEQIKLLKGIAEEISTEQQKQHDHQDERQACFFNLFISYTNSTPRQPITQEDADRCRVEGTSAPTVYAQPATTEASPAPTQSSPNNHPQTSAPSQLPEQASTPEEQTSLLENLLRLVR